MKPKCVGLLILLLVQSCQRTKSAAVPQPPDRFEALAWYLKDKAQELSQRRLEESGNCLAEKNQLMEDRINGRVRPYTLDMKVADAKKLGSSLVADLGALADNMMDTQDLIEESNRRHPEQQKADVKDLLKPLCGDCSAEWAAHKSKIAAAMDRLAPATPPR